MYLALDEGHRYAVGAATASCSTAAAMTPINLRCRVRPTAGRQLCVWRRGDVYDVYDRHQAVSLRLASETTSVCDGLFRATYLVCNTAAGILTQEFHIYGSLFAGQTRVLTRSRAEIEKYRNLLENKRRKAGSCGKRKAIERRRRSANFQSAWKDSRICRATKRR